MKARLRQFASLMLFLTTATLLFMVALTAFSVLTGNGDQAVLAFIMAIFFALSALLFNVIRKSLS
jgi:hypothetical protein